MNIYFKDSQERLDFLIDECLEDLQLYGMYHSVALIFKDNFVLEDYEHREDLQLYADEKAYKVKLIELLIMLYSFKTNTKIGSVLRAYRMANDFSIEALTKELDIPYRSYQDWELGNRTPNAKDLFKLIRYFEIDMEYVEKAFEIENKNIGGRKMKFSLWFADSGEVIGDFEVEKGNVESELEINSLLKQFNISLEELKEKLEKDEKTSLYYDDGTEVICSKI